MVGQSWASDPLMCFSKLLCFTLTVVQEAVNMGLFYRQFNKSVMFNKFVTEISKGVIEPEQNKVVIYRYYRKRGSTSLL